MDPTSLRPNVLNATCPTRRALDLIADKWATLIIMLLGSGPMRFSVLRRTIGGISQKVLAERLRALERSGIVRRTVYPTVPPSVEYALTELGGTLRDPVDAVTHWAEKNLGAIDAATASYDARTKEAS